MVYALVNYSDQIGLLNVLRYITFRTGGAIITALLLVFLFGHTMTRFTNRVTPAKGGLTILATVISATLIWSNWSNTYVWIMVVALLLVGSIGALKPIGRLNDRVLAAVSTAAFVGLFAYLSAFHGIGEVTVICGALIGASFGFLLLT